MEKIYQQINQLLASEETLALEVLTGYQQVTKHWHIPPRNLPEHLIYYICTNKATGTVAGEHIELKPGTLIWLMPHTPHTFCASSATPPPRLYHFRFRLDNPSLHNPENRWLIGHDLEDSMHLVTMYYQDRQLSPPDVNRRVKNILSLLLSDQKNSPSTQFDNKSHGFNRQTIDRIIEFSRKNTRTRPAPRNMAKYVHLSEDYFSRVFKLTFGISARQWLVRQRIMATAEDLQSSGKSISEVAYEYGYDDIFFFSRQFKQIMGKSPRNWLNQH
jgi:AraC-like DNA-binding protein